MQCSQEYFYNVLHTRHSQSHLVKCNIYNFDNNIPNIYNPRIHNPNIHHTDIHQTDIGGVVSHIWAWLIMPGDYIYSPGIINHALF